MQTMPETESGPRKRDENLSKDGKWRSFPKVPHLLQYVSNGNYSSRPSFRTRDVGTRVEREKFGGELTGISSPSWFWSDSGPLTFRNVNKSGQLLDSR